MAKLTFEQRVLTALYDLGQRLGRVETRLDQLENEIKSFGKQLKEQTKKLDQVINDTLPYIERLTIQSAQLDQRTTRLGDYELRLFRLEGAG